MAYAAIKKGLQKKIFLSVNYPILASIAIHGLVLGVILPNTDFDATQESNLLNTSVIELNETEQTRLPNLSPSQKLDTGFLPQLPSLNAPSTENSLPLVPSLPPLFNPNVNAGPNSVLPSPPPVNSSRFSNYYDYNANIPVPSQLPPPPALAPLGSDSFSVDTPPDPEIITQRQLEIAALSSNPESNTMVKKTDEDEYEEKQIRASLFTPQPPLDENGVNPRNLINQNKIPQPIPYNPNQHKTNVASSSNSDSNLNLSNQNQIAINSSNMKEKPFSPLSDQLLKDSQNTTNEEALKNDISWREKVQAPTPTSITIGGNYPKAACMRKLEGSVTYGVVLNPGGVVSDVKLIKSSGYGIFNQQALQQIQTGSFAQTADIVKAYHVNVNFKYDPQNCPSLNVANLGQFDTPSTSKVVNPNSPESSSPTKKPAKIKLEEVNEQNGRNSPQPVQENQISQPKPNKPNLVNSQPPLVEEKTNPTSSPESQSPKVEPNVYSQPSLTKEKTETEVSQENPIPPVEPTINSPSSAVEKTTETISPSESNQPSQPEAEENSHSEINPLDDQE